LQQNLAAAISHLGFVSSRWKHDAFSQEMTAQISRLLKEAIGISRNLSHELNPPGLAYSNLQETFDWLAGQMQLKHGITVHVDILDEIVVQSEALKTFLFKAAQEMLFNAIKHAKVQECRIKLRRRGENISLLVSDRGCGFTIKEARKQGGSGLLRLRERANLLGGSMRIHSRAGKGSTVRIVVPDKP
jgi:signal transduction histidine kinase